jgi:succinylglutamic semialdehyde dehydrogenase
MSEHILKSHNPANGDILWEGLEAGQHEIDQAFETASEALDAWSSLPLVDRITHLENFKEFLNHMQDFFAETISIETGKPLWESKTEVTAMMNKVDISIEAYTARCKEIKRPLAGMISTTRHKPQGVVAVFGPYNFPGHLPNGHIIPALLAGNTIIFKPSEQTPLVGELMYRCWIDSGLPAGVINLVQGGASTGKQIAAHPHLNGLFFTGSWPTGKALLKQFANHPEKILALEMGGNNPLIFYNAKNNEAAAYLTIQSAYITTGQRCTCARRLIVVEGEHSQPFLDSLLEQVKGITIGPYNKRPEPFMGPLISEKAAEKLVEAQQKLLALGGVAITPVQMLKSGTGFIKPGLIDVTDVSRLPDEEYFGPLLQLIRVKSLEEAIETANQTAFGLAAGLISDDAKAYEQFYREIKSGIINWNTPLTGASSAAPFGGIGRSGNFRPSAFYAADYCSYPVASLETETLKMPEKTSPGLLGKI